MTTLLKAPELADKLGISIKTIRKWTCEKKIPYIKLGSSVRFREDEILKWIDSNHKEAI